jgi:hypothetical protein
MQALGHQSDVALASFARNRAEGCDTDGGEILTHPEFIWPYKYPTCKRICRIYGRMTPSADREKLGVLTSDGNNSIIIISHAIAIINSIYTGIRGLG